MGKMLQKIRSVALTVVRYAEEETYPYLRDLIFGSVKNNTRLFLSYLSSIQHHPWGTPDYYDHVQYTGTQGSVDHNLMNNYLNTIRYVDAFLGKVLGILDEAGISNKTLIAITADQYVCQMPIPGDILTCTAAKHLAKTTK